MCNWRPDASQLNEIVVTGYGLQKKGEITSSVANISSEQFNRGNVNDPNQLLQGKVAGLTIAKAGGDINKPFTVRLRGLSTLGANSQPLVVIDGVIGGSLDLIDPSDIASISVLKDASASAIYGTRGSSGVIIVTTKSGQSVSGARLEYNSYVSSESVSNHIRLASPEEYVAAGGVDHGGNTDWVDEVTRAGISHVHNLAFSSNNGSLSYRASVNYRDVEGTLDKSGFKQFNARLNISQKLINDRLKLTSIVSITNRESDISFPHATRFTLNFPPTAPIFDPDGLTSQSGYFQTNAQDAFNPREVLDLNTNLGRKKSFIGSFIADFEVVDGLNLSANYSVQNSNNATGRYISSQSLWALGNAPANNGIADRASRDDLNELFQLTANYNGKVGELTYTVLGGYGFQEIGFDEFNVRNTDFLTNEVTFNNLDIGNGFGNPTGIRSVGSRRESSKLISYFTRANLNYRDAYYLSASYRREGSSSFGPNNRWGNFWALSGGIDITQLAALGPVDNLKVRAGYGVTGNPPINATAYLGLLGKSGQGLVNGAFVPAIAPITNPNPDLKWEEKGEFNVGVDFSLLDFRLNGSLDYFVRTTSDLLNTVDVPTPPNEFGSTLVNVGELETKGFEFQLSYLVMDKPDFKWDILANFSTFKTKLIQWNLSEGVEILKGNIGPPGLNNTYIVRLREGDEIGNILASPFVRWNEDGIAVMLDKDGNETLDRDTEDFVVAGNGIPDFNIGLTNTFAYKGFDLNVFLRGSFGHSLANVNRAYFEHPGRALNYNFIVTEFYNPDDTELDAWHTGYVEDASFIRLDNVTLGYTFNLPEESAFRNIRLYASGQNLFTITGYSGADPEVRYVDPGPSTEGDSRSQYTGDILAPGMDRRVTYFPTRTLLLGVNVTF